MAKCIKVIIFHFLIIVFITLTIFANIPYTVPKSYTISELIELERDDSENNPAEIPKYRLRIMTTDALLYSFLNHPYLSLSLVQGHPLDLTYWQGTDLNQSSDPLWYYVAELMRRKDFSEVILKAYQHVPSLFQHGLSPYDVEKLSWLEFLLVTPQSQKEIIGNERKNLDRLVDCKVRERVKSGYTLYEYVCHYYTDTYTSGYWDDTIIGQYNPSSWNEENAKKMIVEASQEQIKKVHFAKCCQPKSINEIRENTHPYWARFDDCEISQP